MHDILQFIIQTEAIDNLVVIDLHAVQDRARNTHHQDIYRA